MASRELERIRNAVLDHRYSLTEHAYEEMNDDNLDVLDVEAAILTGDINQVLTADPRGTVTLLREMPRMRKHPSEW